MTDTPMKEIAPGVLVHGGARQIIHERPTPDELDDAGLRVRTLRHNITVLRGEVESLRRGWAPLPGDDERYRDVEGLLTAALVMLYDAEVQFPKRAEVKREALANPDNIIKPGFSDPRREDALTEVWWWDKYHQDFGPDLAPMPWRAPSDKPWRAPKPEESS